MSDTDEQNSLLADVDDSPEPADEQTIAMRQMMGFSSFGGPQKPKRQPRGPKEGRGFGTGANSQPLNPRTASTSTTTSTVLSATSNPFVSASLPPRPSKQDQVMQESFFPQAPPSRLDNTSLDQNISNPAATQPFPTVRDILSTHQTSSNQLRTTNTSLDDVGYTNPTTGISFTKRQLAAYERGVVEQVTNNDGSVGQVKVYFKPNFIEENPWEELEVKAGLEKRISE